MLTGVKLIVFLAIFAGAALAQEVYGTHVCVTSRTGVTSDKVTIAGVTATPTRVQMINATFLSTVDGTVKFERSGTAATTTAAVITPVNPGGGSSRLNCYSNSNVGTGTTISITFKLTAGEPLSLNLRNIVFQADGPTKNVTAVITLGSSGDIQTQLTPRESIN